MRSATFFKHKVMVLRIHSLSAHGRTFINFNKRDVIPHMQPASHLLKHQMKYNYKHQRSRGDYFALGTDIQRSPLYNKMQFPADLISPPFLSTLMLGVHSCTALSPSCYAISSFNYPTRLIIFRDLFRLLTQFVKQILLK